MTRRKSWFSATHYNSAVKFNLLDLKSWNQFPTKAKSEIILSTLPRDTILTLSIEARQLLTPYWNPHFSTAKMVMPKSRDSQNQSLPTPKDQHEPHLCCFNYVSVFILFFSWLGSKRTVNTFVLAFCAPCSINVTNMSSLQHHNADA